MTTLDEKELKKLLEDTLHKIDGDPLDLPKVNDSNEMGPYIEIGHYGYEYVCKDRGQEIFRKLPYDTEELLYLVFDDITTDMAYTWEAKNRLSGQDRRILFYERRIELMSKIKKEFGDRTKKEMEWDFRTRPMKDISN